LENDVSDWYTVACVIDEREFARRYARAGDVALSEKSHKKRCVCLWLALALAAGCRRGAEIEGVPAMQLTSSAFQEGAAIPKKHTADGADVSPLLKWQGAPQGTKSFALICDDPDAPRGNWVHWVIFNIPADKTELPEGVETAAMLADGSRQGKNDFRKLGYGGPSPPPGKPHRYFFKLYALDCALDLKEGAGKQEVEKAMANHILAQGQLMGKYGR
jgi:Raf kinase inhibitor-like YbhB/YbcL family protein